MTPNGGSVRRAASRGAVAAMLVVASSWVRGDGQVPEAPTSIDPPAPAGSTSPALAAEATTTADQDHEILMTWLEPDASGERLRFARLAGGSWSRPVTVAEPVSMPGPADPPSLTVIDTPAVRRTLIARTGGVVARSGDGGRNWTRLPAPALRFASFAGGNEGAYAFWLADQRHGAAKLVGTRVLAGGTLLDPQVSGGCATSAAMTWDGPVVAYWDRGGEGTRRVAVVRRHGGQWTRPRAVHAEGWLPAGEPESGPQVAARRRQVAVAWHTGRRDRPRVLVAFSADAGRTFGAPVEVDAAGAGHAPSGPVAVALDDDGRGFVLWMAGGRTDAMLKLARVSPDGWRGEALVLASGRPDRVSGIPQIAWAGDRVAVTWLDGVVKRVRAVAVPLGAIHAPRDRPPLPAAPRASAEPRGDWRGEPAPDLTLVSLDGARVSLASLRGRAVLLNLWATWCGPCVQEMPELAALHERHARHGLVVVGVNVDGTEAGPDRVGTVRAFVSERMIPFSVWLDPEMRLPRALRVPALPATFVIDRAGRIVWRGERPITADDPELGEALARALSAG